MLRPAGDIWLRPALQKNNEHVMSPFAPIPTGTPQNGILCKTAAPLA